MWFLACGSKVFCVFVLPIFRRKAKNRQHEEGVLCSFVTSFHPQGEKLVTKNDFDRITRVI
jgi:hypothetical protein